MTAQLLLHSTAIRQGMEVAAWIWQVKLSGPRAVVTCCVIQFTPACLAPNSSSSYLQPQDINPARFPLARELSGDIDTERSTLL